MTRLNENHHEDEHGTEDDDDDNVDVAIRPCTQQQQQHQQKFISKHKCYCDLLPFLSNFLFYFFKCSSRFHHRAIPPVLAATAVNIAIIIIMGVCVYATK